MDIFAVVPVSNPHQILHFIFVYVGPETMLPLTSALAAIVGVLLMFWQRFVGLVRKIWRLIVRKEVDV